MLGIIETVVLLAIHIIAMPFIAFFKLFSQYDWFANAPILLKHDILTILVRGKLAELKGKYADAEMLYRFALSKGGPLEFTYSKLMKLQLIMGDVEAAVDTVIAASNYGITFEKFDSRIAHIIKAGFAANRLLEDSGLALMDIKLNHNPILYDGKNGKVIPFRNF